MASEVKWIKIVTDIFDDEKILLIESMPERDAIIVIWFKLLCLCGKQNNGGILMLSERIAYTDEMLSVIFRRPINTVRLALKTFEQYGMIEIINNTITIPNWDKHQSLDKLKKAAEGNRLRQARYRENHRTIAVKEDSNVSVTLHNATDKDIDIEIDKEEDIISSADKPQKTKRFTPPSVEDVKAYCQERQNNVDAERFVDYYTSNGWHVGKNPMKDWKAAVRTWERQGWNGYGFGGDKKKPSKDPYANSSISQEDLDLIFSPEFQGLSPNKPKCV